jgi:hypothetical protein
LIDVWSGGLFNATNKAAATTRMTMESATKNRLMRRGTAKLACRQREGSRLRPRRADPATKR